MRLIFLGAPGAGKGTQAQILTDMLGLPKLSTSEILRYEIANGTQDGFKLKQIMDSGQLVSDDIINKLVAKRLKKDDVQKGFIFDGYPRTRSQAEVLQEILRVTDHLKHTHVLNLSVTEPELIRRFSGRLSCLNCNSSYHNESKKPKLENVCDKCGNSPLIVRADDNEQAVKIRLGIYYDKTEPLIKFYNKMGMLYNINGEQEISNITSEILLLLKINDHSKGKIE